MHNPHSTNKGISSLFSFNKLLSVIKIVSNMYKIAIEKRKKSNVVESTPFSVKVLTNIPVDPNIIPASIGRSKYIFFIISQIIPLLTLFIYVFYDINFYSLLINLLNL